MKITNFIKNEFIKIVKFVLNPLLRRLSDIQNEIDYLKKNNIELIDQIKFLVNSKLILENQIDIFKKKYQELDQLLISDVRNIFYFHGGSGNHGCEAIVRSLVGLGCFAKEETCLYSYRPEEDITFELDNIVKYIKKSILNSNEFNDLFFAKTTIGFSVGGDNYCYPGQIKSLAEYNKILNKKGAKTALIGCSIEPELLINQDVLEDLNLYSLITARESITYNALIKSGIKRNVFLIPDSAFTLKTINLPLPDGFEEDNTIGLNLSNLVCSYGNSEDMVYKNYVNLIKYIIKATGYKIALIPHVIQPFNDDLAVLNKLYNEFKFTNRVVFIKDYNSMELKGFISKCKMFIGARTHATIAAYSSLVPTVAIGYSIKSKGIASDIFGTDKNYVLSVNSLKDENDLIKSFLWLNKNCKEIKKHLSFFMPNYIEKCHRLKPLIGELRNQKCNLMLANKDVCTGCGACVSICPINCIKMVDDENGFKYPITDYKKCVNCDLCKKVCPTNINLISNKHEDAYAVKSKNLNTRLKSSSGGVFSILATEIINKKGIVFGAGFDNLNRVVHMDIKNMDELSKLRGSKYVQSDLKKSYRKVEKYLKQNKEVLFSGTPCQVLGLKNFLRKDYENLLCVDVICHGVPSPNVFKKHLGKLEKEYKSSVVLVNFRNKKDGWSNFKISYTFANKKTIDFGMTEDKFMKSFHNNSTLRESCFNCFSKDFKSESDITLGDYWGVNNIHPEFNDEKGVSLVLLNSIKGKSFFEKIKKRVDFISTQIDIAIKNNPTIVSSVKKGAN